MPVQVDHLALPVFDVRKAQRFYTEVLGVPLVGAFSGDDWGGEPWLMMIFAFGDGRQLALCALRGAKRPRETGLPRDVRHFGFAVASSRELNAWKRRLRARRVAFREEDHGTQRSIYFEDPEGTILEITAPPSAKVTRPDPSARELVERWIRG